LKESTGDGLPTITFRFWEAEALSAALFFDKECQTRLQCPVAVLSYGFWQRRFGSDQGVIGNSADTESPALHGYRSGGPDFHGAEMTVPECLDSGNDAACVDA